MARKSNTWFQFKQFRVEQGDCAMKITLDACLFGAMVDVSNSQRILDIGAGTGLLSLMAAQRCNAAIDAVELDTPAAAQAKENFQNSPWANRLYSKCCAVQALPTDTPLYDTIICNPPFFEDSLKAPDHQRNLARHTDSLGFDDLVDVIEQQLQRGGTAWLLLPVTSATRLLSLVNDKDTLNLIAQTAVRSREKHADHRHILVIRKSDTNDYSFYKRDTQKSEMTVLTPSNEYTQEVRQLLSPYFLKL